MSIGFEHSEFVNERADGCPKRSFLLNLHVNSFGWF